MRSVGGRNPGGDTLPYHCLSTCPTLPNLPILTYQPFPTLLTSPSLSTYLWIPYPTLPYHSLSTYLQTNAMFP